MVAPGWNMDTEMLTVQRQREREYGDSLATTDRILFDSLKLRFNAVNWFDFYTESSGLVGAGCPSHSMGYERLDLVG
jgi:hypothetical protein